MKKLKKLPRSRGKAADEAANDYKSMNTKPLGVGSKGRTTKGFLYRQKHNYVQTYLTLDKNGKYKKPKKPVPIVRRVKPAADATEKTSSQNRRQRFKNSKQNAGSDDETDGADQQQRKDKRKDNQRDVVTTKAQRRTAFRKEQKARQAEKLKEKAEENNLYFGQFKDEVEFGEVVHAPPKITAKPRGTDLSTDSTNNKPGQRSLLLKSLTNPQSTDNQIEDVPRKRPSKSHEDSLMSKRRKYLMAGERRIIETEQKRVMDAYRSMKKKR